MGVGWGRGWHPTNLGRGSLIVENVEVCLLNASDCTGECRCAPERSAAAGAVPCGAALIAHPCLCPLALPAAGVRGSLVICFLLNIGSRLVMAATQSRWAGQGGRQAGGRKCCRFAAVLLKCPL